MDDPFAGDDRQHKSWRDLPPTPPLVWPATARIRDRGGRCRRIPDARRRRLEAAPTPARRRHRRPRRRASCSSAPGCSTDRQPARGAAGAARRPVARAAEQGGRRWSRPAMSRSPTRPRGCCPRSSRSRPTARSAPGFVAADGGLILTASHVVGRVEHGHAPAPGRHEHLRRRGRGRQVHRHRRHPGR